VEKEDDLGGLARRIHTTLDGMDVQAFLRDLIRKVYRHPLIHVFTGAAITDAAGYVGNFITRVRSAGRDAELKHGVAVIAVGADLYRPAEYLYGADDRVMTHLELEERIAAGDAKVVNASSVVMIQCVGCRNEDRNYCSRICCSESIKNALKLKELNPLADVYILFRDIRTYGYYEDYYREAASKDIRFIRYEPEAPPQVEAAGDGSLKVTVPDYILGMKLELDADLVALAAAVVPAADSKKVAGLFKVSLGVDEFFKEAHAKLRPVEFATDGVYLCGAAHNPKFIPETISQAYGAAGRALTLLSHDTVLASGSVCEVDEQSCISCGACISACRYGAIEFRDTPQGKKAVVNPILCKGDGLCNAKCPTGAIQLKHFTDQGLLSEIDAALAEEEHTRLIDAAV
jgi:heterodisulfide reductase subunit A2